MIPTDRTRECIDCKTTIYYRARKVRCHDCNIIFMKIPKTMVFFKDKDLYN